MEKVKIKRQKKAKRKISTKEKIFAGLGLASTIFGGGGAVSSQKSQSQIVSRVNTQGTKTEKLAEKLGSLFGIKTAKAYGEWVSVTNNTRDDIENFRPGDSVTISVFGEAGSTVLKQTDGSGWETIGTIDGSGLFNHTRNITESEAGVRSEEYKLIDQSGQDVYLGSFVLSVF